MRVPSSQEAAQLPRSAAELSNEALVILAEQGNHDACYERLIRNIMTVDQISWFEANRVAKRIAKVNQKSMIWGSVPASLGVSVGIFSGVVAPPLVFDQSLAMWFNNRFVTQPLPDAEDMETVWEIGAWTWTWMEPALGTASFVLLAAQFTRAQMLNLNIRPYTHWLQQKRAEKLASRFPQYCDDILADFAKNAK